MTDTSKDIYDDQELTESTDYSTLSHDELVAKIIELEKQLAGSTPPPNDWHSMMYALLHIVLFKYKNVDIKHEFPLGAQPPRADFVVVDEQEVIDLNLDIFKLFRKTNIIEFKSPDDELSEAVLWKVVGYAGFYISKYKADTRDITLTLIRDTKPAKLLREFDDYIDGKAGDGIYYIKDWKVGFPIQIVVTSELKGDEYAAFRAISKKPQIEDIEQLLKEVSTITDPELIGWIRDYLDLFSRLDSETIEEAKRRDPGMAKTWRDIFGVDEEINNARSDERRTNLFVYVQDGAMNIDYAAKQANIPTDQFLAEMTQRGYHVPELV